MEEKIYKTMSSTGAANLAIGICVLVGGIVSESFDRKRCKIIKTQRKNYVLMVSFQKERMYPFKGTLSLLFSCNKSAYFTNSSITQECSFVFTS